MELRHLRYFVVVAEELNFVKAAERLHISEPPLNQQITQLETELGLKLLDRTRRHITLTPAGRAFADRAALILAETQEAVCVATRVSRGEAGQLRVGYHPNHVKLTVECLRVLAERYPGVSVAMNTVETVSEMIESLMEDRVDVGFLRLPIDATGLTVEVVLREPLVVAMSQNNPLSACKLLSIEQLANEPLIIFPRRSQPWIYDIYMQLFRSVSLTPKVAHERGDLYSVLALVAANCGVAFMASSAQNHQLKGVVFRKLRPLLHVELGIARKTENQSEIACKFTEIVKATARRKN